MLSGFSWQQGSTHLCLMGSPPYLNSVHGFPCGPHRLTYDAPAQPFAGWPTSLRPPIAPSGWFRNVDRMSIVYASRPRLRIRLTPGGRTCPGKPWDSGDRDSHPVFRYSCPHNHLSEVHRRFRARLRPVRQRSPTSSRSADSALRLTPDHFRRGISRPVSCYALFK